MLQYDFKSDPRLLLDLARERLQRQLSFADSLDSKIAMLFAVGSALVGLLAAIFSLQPEEFGRAAIVIVSICLLAYALVTIVAAVANWPQLWRIGVSIDWAWDRSQEVGEEVLLPELISGYMDYWRKNSASNRKKARLLRAVFVAILVETLCLVAAVAVVSG